MRPRAIVMFRTGAGERIRDTRLDVLAGVGTDGGDEVWIADGDAGEVLLRIPACHIQFLLLEIQRTLVVLDHKPPEPWFGGYKPEPAERS